MVRQAHHLTTLSQVEGQITMTDPPAADQTIEYLRNFFHLSLKRTERADSAIVANGYDGRERHPQIFNLQFRLVRVRVSLKHLFQIAGRKVR